MENRTRLKRLVKMIKGEVERLGQIESPRCRVSRIFVREGVGKLAELSDEGKLDEDV